LVCGSEGCGRRTAHSVGEDLPRKATENIAAGDGAKGPVRLRQADESRSEEKGAGQRRNRAAKKEVEGAEQRLVHS
jgi:hypothetical protein